MSTITDARMSRRGLLLGTAAATTVSTFGIRTAKAAAAYEYKYGTNVPATHPLSMRAQEAADAIAKETDGRFLLRVFPNNQLGGDTDMLAQLRSGGLEFFSVSGVAGLSTLIPAGAMYGIGFVWPDYPTVWRAMDGELGVLLRKQINAAGIFVMDRIWNSGFRQITTRSTPITKPEDLAGLKMRVPVSTLWTSMFSALGAFPTSINLSEVYSALQTKVVDGQENPLVTISTAKFYEVQKHCALTNHMWDGYWFLGNRRAWERLPTDLKEIVSRHINGAALRQRADVENLGNSLRAELQGQGLEFTEPDRSAFREKLRKAGFYDQWRKKFGDQAWGVLEEAVGKLA
ncbi:TRAP transporter substrate-binding protein [Methylobacterium sp. ID0610]|uniref:TRAP transporter substrate-binding protein n=1 Tax=Methylobacterium carpenticola TaxID=3344827 RepID=UPI0036B4C92A